MATASVPSPINRNREINKTGLDKTGQRILDALLQQDVDLTVAQLQALNSKRLRRGMRAFARNGRKNGEGAGVGTGVLAFYDGTNWIACDTGATLAA